MCMNKMRFNMLLEHWKHSHHDIILGHKTSHSTFVPLNSRNQMRMNTTNLDSEHEVSSSKNYEDHTEKKATRVEKKVILPQLSTSQVIFGFQDARHKPLQILSGQMKQIKLHRLSNCSQGNQYSSCVKLIPFTKSSPTAMIDMSIIIA